MKARKVPGEHTFRGESLSPTYTSPKASSSIKENGKNIPNLLRDMSTLLSLLFVAAAANAGSELRCAPLPVDTLGTAVVTASARLRLLASPAPLQRIDSFSLTTRGITDTGDALRRLAGVNLRDYGGAGGMKTVSVRGLGASHTAVTYDGLPVTDAQQGQIDLQRFQVERLSGIELQTLDNDRLLCPVRSMAAAVVNLYAATANATDDRLHGSLTLRQSSWNVYNPSFSLAKRSGSRSCFSFGADYFFGLNDYPFFVSNGIASEHKRRTNSRMQSYTLETNATHTTRGGGCLKAKAFYYNNHRRLPGQVILYVDDNDEQQTLQNAFGQMSWAQAYGRWKVMAAARYNWQEQRYTDVDGQYPGGILRQNYWQSEAYATAGASYRILDGLSAAYAIDYAHAWLTSNLTTDNDVCRDTWQQALSLQYRTRRWNVMARAISLLARDNIHATATAAAATSADKARNVNRISPSFMASYLVTDRACRLYLRGGYKETYRQPTFTESYYYHLGSTTLQPERTSQLSGGITFQSAPASWWRLASLTADAYTNRVKDRIVSVPYNLQVWRTVNLGRTKATGVDLTLESEFIPALHHSLSLAVNYSWQRAVNLRQQGTINAGVQLPYTPLHSGAASLTWQNPWLSAVVHTTFASERWSTLEHMATTNMSGYSEWGAAVFRTFRLKKLSLEARADLVNAFNKRYEVIRRYPMPGRSYKLSLSLKF